MTDYALKLSDDELARYRLMAARARTEEADLWELAGIRPGAQIVDVGCGPGAVTVEMAAVVGPTGSVTGVDRDPAAVAAARVAVANAGLVNVTLLQGDADATGLMPASYHVAVLRHVLAHGAARQQAVVAHLTDLVRPGGCVYLVDVDLTAIRVLPLAPALESLQHRYVDFQRDRGGDPLAGLRLAELMRAGGLEVLAYHGRYTIQEFRPGMRSPAWAAREAMLASGHITAEEVRTWESSWLDVDAAAVRPTIFAPGFVAVGRRPTS